MAEVHLEVVPAIEAEGACSLVRAVTEERVDREHVPPARLASRNPLELTELLERVDPDVRVGADADADRARADAFDGEEPVAEIRLGRRARADPRAGSREQIELVAVRVRRVDHG